VSRVMNVSAGESLIFFEGRIVPFQEARIHVLSACVKYGLAVFEGIRGHWSPERSDLLLTNPRVERGVRARVSSWRRMADDARPVDATVNGDYANSRLAALQAKRDGYDASIMLNSRGKAAEGPTMCLFFVRRGIAVTPDVTGEILESFTRDTVIQLLCNELGVPVQERQVGRSELYDCEEAFFCGTGYEICPIREIDGVALPAPADGSVVSRLIEAYRCATHGTLVARDAWTNSVYAR